jgi:Flp pilus assembly protein TadD
MRKIMDSPGGGGTVAATAAFHHRHGVWLARLKQLDPARHSLRKAIELDPANEKARAALTRIDATAAR